MSGKIGEKGKKRIAVGLIILIIAGVGVVLGSYYGFKNVEGFRNLFAAPGTDLSDAYAREAAKFANTFRLSVPFEPATTSMHVFDHLAVKLMFNTISTGTMVLFGRVAGNWMSYVAVSNKKLIDRAIRLISELGEVDYVTAAETLYRAMEDLDAMPPSKEKPSPVQYTLGLLKK